MNNEQVEDQWVWVVVQDPGEKEQFLGQHNEQENVSFIPAFHSKSTTRIFSVRAVIFCRTLRCAGCSW